MKSFRPDLKHIIFFDYGSHIKFTQSKIIKIFFNILFLILPKQKNLLSIYINKNIDSLKKNNWIKN